MPFAVFNGGGQQNDGIKSVSLIGGDHMLIRHLFHCGRRETLFDVSWIERRGHVEFCAETDQIICKTRLRHDECVALHILMQCSSALFEFFKQNAGELRIVHKNDESWPYRLNLG